jgi:hypothetical protein
MDRHRIKVDNWEELLDFTYLSNTVELSYLWNPETYSKKYSEHGDVEQAQVTHIRDRILKFEREFSKSHVLVRGGNSFSPADALFNRSIYQLAVTIYKYKEMMKDYDRRFPLTELRKGIIRHFHRYRPHLKSAVVKDLSAKNDDLPYFESFRWNGGEYQVAEKPEDVEMAGRFFLLLDKSLFIFIYLHRRH